MRRCDAAEAPRISADPMPRRCEDAMMRRCEAIKHIQFILAIAYCELCRLVFHVIVKSYITSKNHTLRYLKSLIYLNPSLLCVIVLGTGR